MGVGEVLWARLAHHVTLPHPVHPAQFPVRNLETHFATYVAPADTITCKASAMVKNILMPNFGHGTKPPESLMESPQFVADTRQAFPSLILSTTQLIVLR